MQNTSPEVDAYIAQAAGFAKPILKHLRKLFHQASPEIREEMKWNCPHFVQRRIVGSMAAFKHHVSWGFWNAKLLPDPHGLLKETKKLTAFGFKPKDISELPADEILLDYIRAAVELSEQGIKRPVTKKKPLKLVVPKDLAMALKRNRKAYATFKAFSPSHQREYVQWITEAKQSATRERRLATTLEWLSEGKPRNWKYMRN